MLDVFSGSGALGLALAARGAAVTLIESFAPAADAALRAAREQQLGTRVTVLAAPAEQEALRLAAQGARFDVVIVNPPRRGVAAPVRAAVAALCGGSLVYVSCEPATLARDLAQWAQLGLAATRVAPFDLMPQTAEVECVAWLGRAPPPALPVLFESDALLAIDAPSAPRAIPHPADAVALHEPGAAASGVCLFAKRPSRSRPRRSRRGGVRWCAASRRSRRAACAVSK